ncbi:MAG: putative Holliday junction resolvase [bacterium ADurb.BinA186]|nr:MAG: putative Holliday junction resolvase [bacterium ADurb.BinA186]
MKVLGIDIGIKRTGMAVSDELGISVRMLPNLVAHKRALAVERIMNLVRQEKVDTILIGQPEGQSEYSKAVLSRALGLKEELEKVIRENQETISVIMWDESYSSKKAAHILAHSGLKRKDRQLKLDAASAAVLVEEYLSSKKAD